MAAKSHFHVRSNSFPSKSHPLLQQCSDHLERLGSSNGSSSSSISQKLGGLEDLHECVERLLQLQFAQQAFSQGREENWVDQIVDGSLRLLDMCSAAKDAVLHTKECTREIHSAMRRRRSGASEVGLESEVRKYSASRKVVKRAIKMALRKYSSQVDRRKSTSFATNQENETTKAMIEVLREVEAVTLVVFESLLSFVLGPKAQNKLGGWSLVSKLVHGKRIGCEEMDCANEFALVDGAILGLVSAEKVQKDLRNLDLCVQDFEARLESLFRRLIKTRVSLLNILNN